MNAQVCWQDDFVFQFSFKSSTSLTFNFKVKYSNRIRWEDHTWLSRKWWHVRQKSLQNCQHRKSRVTFPLAYLHFTVTYFYGKGQSCGFRLDIAQTVTDMADFVTANKQKNARGLFIAIVRFDLGPLQRSRSRSCTFRLWICHKR